jgi:hypothetical protein
VIQQCVDTTGEEGPVGREGVTSSLSVCPREEVVNRRHSRLALELLLGFKSLDVSVRERPARYAGKGGTDRLAHTFLQPSGGIPAGGRTREVARASPAAEHVGELESARLDVGRLAGLDLELLGYGRERRGGSECQRRRGFSYSRR